MGADKVRENSIRVLLIDDDPVDAELTERALSQVGEPQFATDRAASLASAAERLRSAHYDIALLDLGLPDSARSDTLTQFRSSCSGEIPVIVLTGLADDAHALEALDHGAQDYLAKDDVTPNVLSRSIRYALQRHQLTGQLRISNNLLEQKNQRLAELYETAQQFVENVSHEFRTPLTVIREFTSIIRDGLDGPVTPKQVEHLGKVLNRTDDLALMVDDMLDISKLESGLLGIWRRPCQVSDLIEAVRGLVKGRADSKQITLGAIAPESLPLVFCDEEKVRRVIINLAVNAIKFTPEGGAVDIWASAGEHDGDVTIGVTDAGPGISQENLAIIFERFKQVDQNLRASMKGFGLGLNIAKELVALNLGRINVESKVGVGSTFYFALPRYEPEIVLDRYLDRIGSLEIQPPSVSLLTTEINTRAYPSALAVADEFLQRSVRANDLVASYVAGTWIIAAVCPQQECEPLIRRLTGEWTSFARNCPNAQLPRLEIVYHETRLIAVERAELTQAYLALASRNGDGFRTSRTILVVDDDGEVIQCLSVRLRAAGFEVIIAADGEEGLAAAVEHQPDAVVLDICMPKKGGLSVLREMRANPTLRKTPIIMLSASIRDQQRALEAGASYFISKPYEATQVLSAIDSTMREESLT